MYDYAEKLLAVLKIRREDMQYIRFAEFAEDKLAPEYFAAGDFTGFMNAALRSSFGDSPPDEKTAEAALSFIRKFSSAVYEKSDFFTKLYMKFVSVLI